VLRLVQDVVYAFKPAQDAAVSISLCGSSYDTVLALYSRSNDWAALQQVACNDDFCSHQSYLQVHTWCTERQKLLFKLGSLPLR